MLGSISPKIVRYYPTQFFWTPKLFPNYVWSPIPIQFLIDYLAQPSVHHSPTPNVHHLTPNATHANFFFRFELQARLMRSNPETRWQRGGDPRPKPTNCQVGFPRFNSQRRIWFSVRIHHVGVGRLMICVGAQLILIITTTGTWSWKTKKGEMYILAVLVARFWTQIGLSVE